MGPNRAGLWTAMLFIVGSVLFGLGALPFYSEAVGLRVCALTFFVGSLFFTGAAFLQYREAADSVSAGSHTLAVWAPKNLGWLACVIQLAGTLWFNWSTANALRTNLDAALRSAGVAAGRVRLNRLSDRQWVSPG